MKTINLIIDNKQVQVGREKNLLEVIRKAGIELPTFCYHSELSVYGACRLCMVDIEGRGLQPACSNRSGRRDEGEDRYSSDKEHEKGDR